MIGIKLFKLCILVLVASAIVFFSSTALEDICSIKIPEKLVKYSAIALFMSLFCILILTALALCSGSVPASY